MATYAQWRNGGSRLGRVVYLTAAPSWVLAEEVIADIRDRFPPAETLYASEVPSARVWEALTTYPPDSEDRRLVVVREAERLRHWEPLEGLLRDWRGMPNCTVLFVDGQEVKQGERPPDSAPHGRLLRRSTAAVMVKAVPPTEEELTAWVAGQLPISSQDLARDVLNVAGRDLAAARDLCVKLSALPRRDRGIVSWLAGDPAVDYAEAVIAGNRQAAFFAAAQLKPSDLGLAIGLLARWLDDLSILAPAAARKISLSEIARLGVSRLSALQLLPVVTRYPPAAIHRDRGVLLIAAEAWQAGQSAGVAEVIAAMW